MRDHVFIVAAVRSPIGRLSGCLSGLPGHELGGQVISAMLDQLTRASKLSTKEYIIQHLEEVVVGQVFTAAAGQNPARRAAVAAGIPYRVPAYGVNMLCGSGLKAVCLAYDNLRLSNDPDGGYSIAGGQESMSQAVHATPAKCSLRGNGQNSDGLLGLGDFRLVDTILLDGLTDAFCGMSMGETCELVAKRFAVTREEQDAYAFRSQERYAAAFKDGLWAHEITPIKVPSGNKRSGIGDKCLIVDDEHPRPGSSLAGLGRLKPAFIPADGTITAGNSSGVNDGAAFLLLCRADCIIPGLYPMVRVVGWYQVGLAPELMALAPIDAIRGLLRKVNWSLESVDAFEINEAFAAQSIVVARELSLSPDKMNSLGGGIALGHPLGCSGARVLVTLVHRLCRLSVRTGGSQMFRGIASLCIGGGLGIAMAVETCPEAMTHP